MSHPPDLSKIPLAVNPNGDPPNFVDPPSLEKAVFDVGLTLIIISASCLVVRLITNFKYTSKLGLDDYLCLFGELGGIGYWALIYSLARDGAARHTWDVPVSIVTSSFIKRTFAQQTIIAPTMWASKAAILALYIRIFGTHNWLRLTSYGLMIFMALFYGSNIVIAAVYCIPRDGNPWDATSFARCSSPIVSALVIGSFSAVADLILLMLPFPVLLKLQLTRKKMVGLSIVFLTGILTVVTSIAGVVYRVIVYQGHDPTWNGIQISIVAFAEVFGTCIVSCAPALASFWVNFFTKSKLYSSLHSSLSSRRFRQMTDHTGDSQTHFALTSKLPHERITNSLDEMDGASNGTAKAEKTKGFAVVSPVIP